MDQDFDVVVVGSGVGGALVAWKLAQSGHQVLILEAGNNPIEPGQRQEFREVMVPNSNRGDMHAPYLALASRRYAPSPEAAGRPEEKYYDLAGPEPFKAQFVRLVGGSTWAWRGNTPRLVPHDFRLKTEYGVGIDWPITYDDLEPFYTEAERELGVAGDHGQWNGLLGAKRGAPFPMDPIPLSYGDKLVKEQLDGRVVDGVTVTVRSTPQARATRNYNPYLGDAQLERFFDPSERPACQGNSNCIPLCPIGAKYDATVHLRAAVKTKRVVLRTGCVVTQLIDDRYGRITEVRYKNWSGSNKGEEQRVTAKAVVLAANAIETPRLLLMSNLANRSGQVGRNLMDHLQDELTAFFPEPLYPFRGPQSTCSIEDFRDGPFRAAHSAIRMTVGNDGHARTRSPLDMLDGYLDKGTFGDALVNALANDIPRMMRMSYSTEVLPNPNNRITLSTKPDVYGLPRPQIRFDVDQYTYNGLKKAHEIALALLDGITDIKKDQTKEREWQRKWSTAAHIMGTCRMGTDPMTSVVDPNGRTHDHENLYLVGASVFPTSGTANPTLTLAALALKTGGAVGAAV